MLVHDGPLMGASGDVGADRGGCSPMFHTKGELSRNIKSTKMTRRRCNPGLPVYLALPHCATCRRHIKIANRRRRLNHGCLLCIDTKSVQQPPPKPLIPSCPVYRLRLRHADIQYTLEPWQLLLVNGWGAVGMGAMLKCTSAVNVQEGSAAPSSFHMFPPVSCQPAFPIQG